MRSVYIFTLFFICFGAALAQPVYQKGMSYTPWSQNTLLSIGSTQSIENMSAAGVEWSALTVFWFQDDVNSTGPIEPDYHRYSASRESLVKAIEDMHANGIKVLLKPHVDNRSGAWRGEINPSEAWFDSYEEYIVDWAEFAEDNSCDMFSIGCEYVKTTRGTAWESQWRRIIASVREVYSGPLTYASNHGNETAIPWWDAVDYIGIDAYYPLTNEDDPTLDELRTVWEARANAIESWVERVWPGRPVIFTEIGYRSLDGANSRPWEYDGSGGVDLQEQVDCYQAVLETIAERDWFWGFYWWNWETNPNAGGSNDVGYTPQNKPVEDLVKDWYDNRLIGGRYDASSSVNGFEWYE